MMSINRNCALIGALTVIGFVVRVYSLGDLGFRWDEDLTSIAVKAINEHGYPLLDSGMVYPRFLPLQYLLAGWTTIFGYSEYTVRFPIVLFGTALIPLTYVLARDLTDGRVALIAATLVTFDFWQVELARTARLYAPFFFIYGMFFIAVYRGILWNRRGWRIAIVPLGLMAVWVHDVGLFCAGLVLLPALCFVEHRKAAFPYLASVTLLGFTVIWRKYSAALWGLSERSGTVVERGVELYLADSLAGLRSVLDKLSDYLFVPHLHLVRELLSYGIGLTNWLLVFAGMLFFVFWLTRAESTQVRWAALAAVALAAVHQFTLVAVFWQLTAVLLFQGARGLISRLSVSIGVLLAGAVIFWLVAAFSLGYEATDLKYVVKQLFEYPRIQMAMAYPLQRPLMSIFAAIGAILVLEKVARSERDQNSVMLLGGFLISYFAVGVFASTYSHFRYVLHADIFFVTFAAVGMLAVARIIGDKVYGRKKSVPMNSEAPWLTVIGAAVIALLVVNPLRSTLAVTRDYRADGQLERWLDLGTYPDFKTTSAFILAHKKPGDRILVLNPREFYNYLGKVDGWVRSVDFSRQVVYWDGVPHDKYIGVPLIRTVEELKSLIAEQPGRTWIPFSRRIFGFEQFGGVDEEIARFLQSNADRQVMVGRDGTTVVYLFDRT